MLFWSLVLAFKDFFAVRKWNKYLLREMKARPQDKVKVLDTRGQPLGWGLREQQGIAIPFDWFTQAASVEESTEARAVDSFLLRTQVCTCREGSRRQEMEAPSSSMTQMRLFSGSTPDGGFLGLSSVLASEAAVVEPEATCTGSRSPAGAAESIVPPSRAPRPSRSRTSQGTG